MSRKFIKGTHENKQQRRMQQPRQQPCTKVRYRDKGSALLALDTVQRKFDDEDVKVEKRAYRCPLCKGWHLTSTEKRR